MPELKQIHVHFLPRPGGLRTKNTTAVIVDILRASTTMVTALENGAAAILPCLTTDEAFAHRESRNALLGGERGGVIVEGFDLGNSPRAYDRDVVANREIAFTTTNGTRAIAASLAAREIVIGAFANISALVDHLCETASAVDIVCAGTDGQVTGEDVLFAGLLATRLAQNTLETTSNDETRIAMDFSAANAENPLQRLEMIRQSQGGRNLIALGFDEDIAFAAEIDRFLSVPRFDPEAGHITI